MNNLRMYPSIQQLDHLQVLYLSILQQDHPRYSVPLHSLARPSSGIVPQLDHPQVLYLSLHQLDHPQVLYLSKTILRCRYCTSANHPQVPYLNLHQLDPPQELYLGVHQLDQSFSRVRHDQNQLMFRKETDGDWVTMGVLYYKAPHKSNSSGNEFSIWKLTDLRQAHYNHNNNNKCQQ